MSDNGKQRRAVVSNDEWQGPTVVNKKGELGAH